MTLPTILIASTPDQAEVRALLEHLTEDEYLLLDDDWLQRNEVVEWRLEQDGTQTSRLGKTVLDFEALQSIYVRPRHRSLAGDRPMPNFLRPHPSVADSDAAFVQAEAETTLFAILSQFKKLWVNNPFNEKLTENKLYQLAIARDFGLRVPETIASSDVNALQEFWNKHEGEVIVKAVSAYPARYVSDGVIVTRQVSSNDIKLLKTSTPSVNLFQELIPAILDIRVTIVGDSVFATAIHSQEGKSPLDWRLDYTVPFTTYELDDKTLTALSQIASRLGLVYGAADLRIMPTGEPVFLEINPYGSFFFIEKLTNQPISGALADLLRSGKLTRPIYPAT